MLHSATSGQKVCIPFSRGFKISHMATYKDL